MGWMSVEWVRCGTCQYPLALLTSSMFELPEQQGQTWAVIVSMVSTCFHVIYVLCLQAEVLATQVQVLC